MAIAFGCRVAVTAFSKELACAGRGEESSHAVGSCPDAGPHPIRPIGNGRRLPD